MEAIKTLCYQTFVRPIVKYASTVWDPSTEKNIKSVENMQRQAARFEKSDHRRRSSVTTMLESLNWVSLASRRAEAKLVMLYRITNNLVDVTTSAVTAAPKPLLHAPEATHTATYNHSSASKPTSTPSFRAPSNHGTHFLLHTTIS